MKSHLRPFPIVDQNREHDIKSAIINDSLVSPSPPVVTPQDITVQGSTNAQTQTHTQAAILGEKDRNDEATQHTCKVNHNIELVPC